mgnify:FL=1
MNNSKKVLSVLFISLFTITSYAGTSDDGGSFFGMGNNSSQGTDNTIPNERRFLPKGDLSDMSPAEIKHLQNMRKMQTKQEIQTSTFNKMVMNKKDKRAIDYNEKLQYVYQRQLKEDDLTPEQKQKIYKGLRKAKAQEAVARKKYEQTKDLRDKAYADMVKQNEQDMLDEVTKIRQNRLKENTIDVQQFFDYTKTEKYQKNLKAINKQAQETIRTAKKNEKPKQVFHYESERKGLTAEEKQKLQEFLNSPEGQNLAPTVKQSVEDLLKGKTRVDNKPKARKQNRVFFDFDGEEEEEEAVNLPTQIGSLAEAEKLFDKDGKGGVLIPNQPIHMAPQVREAIRKRVELLVKTQGLYGMRSFERDALNAMLFNYGVQLLDDGSVIALEPVDDPVQTAKETPEVAPGIEVPKGAQEVVIGEYAPTEEDENLPKLDELNNTTASKGNTPSDAVEDYEYGYDAYQKYDNSSKGTNTAGERAEKSLKEQTLQEFNLEGEH